MPKIFTFLMLIMCASLSAQANKTLSTPATTLKTKEVNNLHGSYHSLLQKHVDNAGKVNYKGFLKDKLILQAYLKSLEETDLTSLSQKQQMAFWINVYNAATIDQILRNYPTKTIKNIADGKIWDKPLPYIFNGKSLSLNEIENLKLLKNFNDARIHFAINCAAASCPQLINQAYTDKNLEQLLTNNTQTFLNNAKLNVISKNKVMLSQIFNWFKPDFVKAEGSVINFINKYNKLKINKQNIEFLEYNWDLNEQ